jgi:hypothetical protein
MQDVSFVMAFTISFTCLSILTQLPPRQTYVGKAPDMTAAMGHDGMAARRVLKHVYKQKQPTAFESRLALRS